jgi:hypothetical protein
MVDAVERDATSEGAHVGYARASKLPIGRNDGAFAAASDFAHVASNHHFVSGDELGGGRMQLSGARFPKLKTNRRYR